MSEEMLSASGGLLAPYGLIYPYPDVFYVTYRVQGIFRRWWFRHTGWSTEWTVEYERRDVSPVRDALPSFQAVRGGIEIK